MNKIQATRKMQHIIRTAVVAGLNKPIHSMYAGTSLIDERNKGLTYFTIATVGRKIISDLADHGIMADVFMIRGMMREKNEAIGNWVEPDYVMCVKWKDIFLYVCIENPVGEIFKKDEAEQYTYIEEVMPCFFQTNMQFLMRCTNLFKRKQQNFAAIRNITLLKSKFSRKKVNYEIR